MAKKPDYEYEYAVTVRLKIVNRQILWAFTEGLINRMPVDDAEAVWRCVAAAGPPMAAQFGCELIGGITCDRAIRND